ncbi:transcription factor S-II, central domain-containing protein [Schizophyllum amplum]|uniref:Transcription elongation factor n=1 Tax=Schizophyllum amplum TaxID=97359 RepID=A0A550CPS4_9AGAR|nr:transcription factor S-II, central domain-containing protein [Auriculariopsis ampla]
MSDVVELKKLVKQLQSPSTDQEMLSILGLLKKNWVINETILRESKAGLAVGKLRTHQSKDVSQAAKDLVKKWKTDVERLKGSHKSPAPGAPSPKVAASPSIPPPAKPSAAVRTAITDNVSLDFTGEKLRDTMIKLIYNALACDATCESSNIAEKARDIEAEVHKANGGTTEQYKSKNRTLTANLKAKGNPGLRAQVLKGELAPARLAVMSVADMASEERKAADSKIREQTLHEALGAAEQEAETDAFQCGRCKQRKCRYRQAQTRSADEPMTTFVTCTVCNNRWKFS